MKRKRRMREGRGDRADHLTGVAIESGVLIARSKKLMTFPIEGSGTSELALRVGGIYIYIYIQHTVQSAPKDDGKSKRAGWREGEWKRGRDK